MDKGSGKELEKELENQRKKKGKRRIKQQEAKLVGYCVYCCAGTFVVVAIVNMFQWLLCCIFSMNCLKFIRKTHKHTHTHMCRTNEQDVL